MTGDYKPSPKPLQAQYLSNCSPTPPLIQQYSPDNKVGLMLGQCWVRGKGWRTVSQILILVQYVFEGGGGK